MKINVAFLGVGTVLSYAAWTYFPRAPRDVPLANHGAAQVMAFMEKHKLFWSHDVMLFANSPSALARMVEHPGPQTDTFCFTVTVNSKKYDHVPIRRVTAFLPSVLPSDVATRFIEPRHRLRWDKNYRFFEDFVTLPVPKAAQQLRRGFTPTLRHWSGHVLESNALDKLGVQPRSFIYERLVGTRDDGAYCLTYRSLDGTESADGVVIPQSLKHLQAPGAPLARRLRDYFFGGPAAGSTEVLMLWQEILLLPVRRRHLELATYQIKKGVIEATSTTLPDTMGVANAAFSAAQEFMTEGSPVESTTHEKLYVPPASSGSSTMRAVGLSSKAARDVAAESRDEIVGCLMVMTSCNDGRLPRVPGPIERYAMRRLTSQTFDMLLADIRSTSTTNSTLASSTT